MAIKKFYPSGDLFIENLDNLFNGYRTTFDARQELDENNELTGEFIVQPKPTPPNGSWLAVAASGYDNDVILTSHARNNQVNIGYETHFYKFIDEGIASGVPSSSGGQEDYVGQTIYGTAGTSHGLSSQTRTSPSNVSTFDTNPYNGDEPWSPDNSIPTGFNGPGTSNGLKVTGWGFSLPEDALGIAGVVVSLRKERDTGRTQFSAEDRYMQLVVNDGPQGDNKANPADWPTSSEDLNFFYGGSVDTWGLGLTIDQVEAGDFGFAFQADSDTDADVKDVEMTVYYSSVPPSGSVDQQDYTAFTFSLEPLKNLKPKQVDVRMSFLARGNHNLGGVGNYIVRDGNDGDSNGFSINTIQDEVNDSFTDKIVITDSDGHIVANNEPVADGYKAVGLDNETGDGVNGVWFTPASSGEDGNSSVVTRHFPMLLNSGEVVDFNYQDELRISFAVFSDHRLQNFDDSSEIQLHALEVEISGDFFAGSGMDLYTSTYSSCVDIDHINPDVRYGSQIFTPRADVDELGTWQTVPTTSNQFSVLNEGAEFDDGFDTYIRNIGGNNISALEFSSQELFYFPDITCQSCGKQEILFSMSNHMPVSSGALPIEVTAVLFSQNGNTLAYKNATSSTPGSGEGIYTIYPDNEYRYMNIPLLVDSGTFDTVEEGIGTSIRVQFYDPNPGFETWSLGSMEVSLCGQKISKIRSNEVDLYVGGAAFYSTCDANNSAFDASWSNAFGNNDCLNMFVPSKEIHTSEPDLDMFVTGGVSAPLDMFLVDSYGVETSGVDFFMPVIGRKENMDLFINVPGNPWNSGVYLNTFALEVENSGIDLSIHGITSDTENLNLYVSGPVLKSGNAGGPDDPFDMYIWGTSTPALSDNVDMMLMSFDEFTDLDSVNISMVGEGSFDHTGSLNMFIGVPGNADGSIAVSGEELPLFVGNYTGTQTNNMDLYLEAPSGVTGAVPYNESLNLHIARGNSSSANRMGLFISGPDGISDSIDMILDGQPSASSGIDLSMVSQDTFTDNLDIYINGF